jgi:hypothetical protein
MPLTAAQWARVRSEFDRLVEAPAELRRAALAALAAEDLDASRELDGLLRAAARTDSRLDQRALDTYAAEHVAAPALLDQHLKA